MVLFCLLQICEWHHSTTSMKRERSSKNGGIGHWCHIVSDCVWHSSDGFLYGSWLVWFLACVWLWMKWTRVLSSCHIVFVVRSDHFHRKSRTQASSTSDIFIKLLIVQWICIWYTKNLLFKLLDLIVKNTKNLCKRLIPLYIFNVQNCDKPTYTCMNIFLNFLYYLTTSEQWMSQLIN